jgi:hypothetical protein
VLGKKLMDSHGAMRRESRQLSRHEGSPMRFLTKMTPSSRLFHRLFFFVDSSRLFASMQARLMLVAALLNKSLSYSTTFRSHNTSTRLFANMGGKILRKGEAIGFKQLFDEDSSTFTYLLWDETTKDAVIVDPVDIQADRDVKEAAALGLNVIFGSTYMDQSIDRNQ